MATPRSPFDGTAGPDPDAAVYVISVAAELTGLHPQTLRTYERLGLITPGRSGGGGRRYSARDIESLRGIAELTASGIGLEGVRRILDLQHHVQALAQRNDELLDELRATREALAQALSQRADADRVPNKLPVLRSPGTSAASSVVVWRRSR